MWWRLNYAILLQERTGLIAGTSETPSNLLSFLPKAELRIVENSSERTAKIARFMHKTNCSWFGMVLLVIQSSFHSGISPYFSKLNASPPHVSFCTALSIPKMSISTKTAAFESLCTSHTVFTSVDMLRVQRRTFTMPLLSLLSPLPDWFCHNIIHEILLVHSDPKSLQTRSFVYPEACPYNCLLYFEAEWTSTLSHFSVLC